MQSTINYGFGIDGKTLGRISKGTLVQFAKNHLQGTHWRTDITEMDEKAVLNKLSHFEDLVSHTEGHYAVISSVITKETGVKFGYEDTEYGRAIMFYAGYPWKFKGPEKDLTPEKLQTLVQPYLGELGIAGTELDYVSVEHFE